MARKWLISPISLLNEEVFRVELYTIRRKISNGIFWDNFQVCSVFGSRVINEKRAKKSVDEISPTRWSWILKSPFSMTIRNSTKFGRGVIGTYLSVLVKFHRHLTDTFQEKQHWKSMTSSTLMAAPNWSNKRINWLFSWPFIECLVIVTYNMFHERSWGTCVFLHPPACIF